MASDRGGSLCVHGAAARARPARSSSALCSATFGLAFLGLRGQGSGSVTVGRRGLPYLGRPGVPVGPQPWPELAPWLILLPSVPGLVAPAGRHSTSRFSASFLSAPGDL